MDEASPHIFSPTLNLSKNIVKWVSVNLSGETTVVDNFIRHMLLSPCNKVITAKDRVLLFARTLLRSQEISLGSKNQMKLIQWKR